MKTLGFSILAVLAVLAAEQNSHAWGGCYMPGGGYYSGCAQSNVFYITSTTFTGPLALIYDGNMDLTAPGVRDLVLAQADQVTNGQSDAIVGANVISVLTKAYGAKDDATMARTLQLLDEYGVELNEANIRKALSQ